MESRSIQVLAYNTETILAEKLETILSRGEQNTHPRDFYDVYALFRLRADTVNISLLRAALNATAEKRGSQALMPRFGDILQTVRESEVMQQRWSSYQRDFEYARPVSHQEVCDTIGDIMTLVFS